MRLAPGRDARPHAFAIIFEGRPQSEFILPGSLVHRLEDGLDVLMRELRRKFGIEIPEKVREVRTSAKESGVHSSEVELSPKTADELRSFYTEDFERLGY